MQTSDQRSVQECNTIVIDSSHAFVHDIPIIAKLVANKQNGSCNLKVPLMIFHFIYLCNFQSVII